MNDIQLRTFPSWLLTARPESGSVLVYDMQNQRFVEGQSSFGGVLVNSTNYPIQDVIACLVQDVEKLKEENIELKKQTSHKVEDGVPSNE